MLSPDQVRQQVRQVRDRMEGPLNLNFFCHRMPPEDTDGSAWRALLQPYYAEFGVAETKPAAMRLPFDVAMCAAVEEVRPDVVSFHFGLPAPDLLERVMQSGAVAIGNATTVEEALWLQDRGVSAIIAQGFEAGGHSGRFLPSDPGEAMGLFALVPQVADAVGVPVIAAGGIADGRGIAAALTLGASAVQLGTAYLPTPESVVSDAHRHRLREGRTLFTNLMTGGLARGLHGRLIDELGAVRSEAPRYPLAAAALAPVRAAAEAKGEYGFGPMWAGQAAPLAESLPATELTRKLAGDALAILERRA
jgi:nitronate monooxygenase